MSREYYIWREAVLKRDDYKCVTCGSDKSILHADHIKQYSKYPELRFKLSNGRTLCWPCHKKTSTYGWKSIDRTNHPYGYSWDPNGKDVKCLKCAHAWKTRRPDGCPKMCPACKQYDWRVKSCLIAK